MREDLRSCLFNLVVTIGVFVCLLFAFQRCGYTADVATPLRGALVVERATALHDRAAVAREWEAARALAKRAIITVPPIVADDLLVAVEHGEDALHDARVAEDPLEIERAVRRVWAAVTHIVVVASDPGART